MLRVYRSTDEPLKESSPHRWLNPQVFRPRIVPLISRNVRSKIRAHRNKPVRYIFFLKALIIFSVLLGPGRSTFLFFLAILHGALTRSMTPYTGRSHFVLVTWDQRFALFFLTNSILVGGALHVVFYGDHWGGFPMGKTMKGAVFGEPFWSWIHILIALSRCKVCISPARWRLPTKSWRQEWCCCFCC